MNNVSSRLSLLGYSIIYDTSGSISNGRLERRGFHKTMCVCVCVCVPESPSLPAALVIYGFSDRFWTLAHSSSPSPNEIMIFACSNDGNHRHSLA